MVQYNLKTLKTQMLYIQAQHQDCDILQAEAIFADNLIYFNNLELVSISFHLDDEESTEANWFIILKGSSKDVQDYADNLAADEPGAYIHFSNLHNDYFIISFQIS